MDDAVDFDRFESETGIVNWWAWSGVEHGFKHRDHYMIAEARPLVKRYEIDTPDANYGRHTTPEKVAATIPRTRRFKNQA